MFRRLTRSRSLWLGVTSFRKQSLSNTTAQRKIGTLRLLVFNTAMSGTLYVVGDVIQQKVFGTADCQYDYTRTVRMCTLGLCMGPLSHFWYLQLDRIVVGEGMKMVMKKILWDQSIFAPTNIIVFYLGMNLLEGNKWIQSRKELQAKFLPTYMLDLAIWPAAQMLNFYFIPGYLRVTYVNVVLVAWTTLLSYLKHRDHNKPISSSLDT